MIKCIWVIFIIAMSGGVYFTVPPRTNESALHYIMSDSGETWQSFAFVVIAAISGTILIMYYLMRRENNDYQAH